MDIAELIDSARAGEWPPVAVLVGPERFLVERAVGLLRQASVGDGPPGFNDDVFHGKGLNVHSVLSAARTLPMMAAARFLLVRDADAIAAADLEPLTAYLEEPSPSTCLVLTAAKLHGSTRFAKAAKKKGAWVEAKELKGPAVRSFVVGEAKARGHAMQPAAADALVDALGADLSAIDDALERLSLFVGEGQRIDLEAVEASVTRVRVETIWALVDAVGQRDQRTALTAAASLLADREPPLRLLAMVARQLRMVAKMREGLARGLQPPEAAKRAGVPPFKARDFARAAKGFGNRDLAQAFATLAEADLALKGSKRPAPLIFEEAILRLCTPGYRSVKPSSVVMR